MNLKARTLYDLENDGYTDCITLPTYCSGPFMKPYVQKRKWAGGCELYRVDSESLQSLFHALWWCQMNSKWIKLPLLPMNLHSMTHKDKENQKIKSLIYKNIQTFYAEHKTAKAAASSLLGWVSTSFTHWIFRPNLNISQVCRSVEASGVWSSNQKAWRFDPSLPHSECRCVLGQDTESQITPSQIEKCCT